VGATRHIRFLASVRSEDEARLAVSEGADIIDCKEPAAGALGALDAGTVIAIRKAVPTHIPVSATIGDLPCEPKVLAPAAQCMASTGVEYVKAGFFPGPAAREAVAALGRMDLGRSRLVAVLFADRDPDFSLVSAMADAGFAGVMIDTAGKDRGALPDILSLPQMKQFLADVRKRGMFAGLAGSLRLEHVTQLRALGPDILGFRGALCSGGQRKSALDTIAMRAVHRALTGPLRAPLQEGREARA
jgi:uncharacterized protein (UPF0264 family)